MALNIAGQLFIDGAWTTRAGYSERGGWDYENGPARDTETAPAKVGFTFANDDLELDPSNIKSSLYGKIGRNTPLRLRINSTTVATVEASSWQPEATMEHTASGPRGVAFVGMTAEGLLRRLSKWEEFIQSPMSRNVATYPGLLAWLPLEDPAGATRLSQGLANVRSGEFSGTVTLGDEAPPGALSGLKMGSDGSVTAVMRARLDTEWEVSWAGKLAAAPTSGTYETILSVTDTQGRGWACMVNNANYRLLVTSDAGATLVDISGAWTAAPPTQWVRFLIRATTSSGTLTRADLQWYEVDDPAIVILNTTFSSTTTGMPRALNFRGNAWTTDALYSHVTASSDVTGFPFQAAALAAFNGHRNELAALRFARLMDEAGLQGYVTSGWAQSMPMGPQPSGTLLELLEECMRTDGALIYDEPTDVALTFRNRVDMTSQAPKLTLPLSQVRYPLRKAIDDSGIANRVTVTNGDGTTAIAQLDDGPISIQSPPLGVGVAKFDLAVNVADADAVSDRAAYELSKRTIDKPRYPQVSVDLFAEPSLTNTVTIMRPGDWIVLSDAQPDPVYLRVIKIQRAGDAVRDVVTFDCVPADLLQVAVIDDDDSRIDSGSTTLDADITDSATVIALTTADPVEYWSVTSTPYDLKIGVGERVTVNRMSMPGSIQGALDGSFDSTVTGWSATNGTFVSSTAQANHGPASGLLTVTGTPTSAFFRNTTIATVVAGFTYRAQAWVRTAVTRSVTLSMDWYISGVYNTTPTATITVTAGQWVPIELVATAPASVNGVRYGVTLGGSPATGTIAYVDDIDCGLVGGIEQYAFVTRAVNGVSRSHDAGSTVSLADPVRIGL